MPTFIVSMGADARAIILQTAGGIAAIVETAVAFGIALEARGHA